MTKFDHGSLKLTQTKGSLILVISKWNFRFLVILAKQDLLHLVEISFCRDIFVSGIFPLFLLWAPSIWIIS